MTTDPTPADEGWFCGGPAESTVPQSDGERAENAEHRDRYQQLRAQRDSMASQLEAMLPVVQALQPLVFASLQSTAPRTPEYQAVIDAYCAWAPWVTEDKPADLGFSPRAETDEPDLCGDVLDDNTRCTEPVNHEWHRAGGKGTSWIHSSPEVDVLERERDEWRRKANKAIAERDEARRAVRMLRPVAMQSRRRDIAEKERDKAIAERDAALAGKAAVQGLLDAAMAGLHDPEVLRSRLAHVVPQSAAELAENAEHRDRYQQLRAERDEAVRLAGDRANELAQMAREREMDALTSAAGEVLLANAEADLKAARAEVARLRTVVDAARAWRANQEIIRWSDQELIAAVDALDQPAAEAATTPQPTPSPTDVAVTTDHVTPSPACGCEDKCPAETPAETITLEDMTIKPDPSSVRDGWHKATCPSWECRDWYATGLESVCEEAALDHIERVHPETPRGDQ